MSEGIELGMQYRPGALSALMKGQRTKYLIENLIAKDALLLLAAESKQGKSVLCTNLALAVAQGIPWLGHSVSQGPVLWCCYEESPGERHHILGMYPGIEDAPLHTVWPPDGIYVDDPDEGMDWLRAAIVASGATLLVIDPLAAACKGDSFDEIGEGRKRLQPLKKLCTEMGVTTIVIHHLNKDYRQGRTNRNRQAGSHQLMAAASLDWTMFSEEAPDGSSIIEIGYHGRQVGRGSFKISSSSETHFEPLDEERRGASYDKLRQHVLENPGKSYKREELGNIAGVERSTAGEHVKKLMKEGLLTMTRGGPNTRYFCVDLREGVVDAEDQAVAATATDQPPETRIGGHL